MGLNSPVAQPLCLQVPSVPFCNLGQLSKSPYDEHECIYVSLLRAHGVCSAERMCLLVCLGESMCVCVCVCVSCRVCRVLMMSDLVIGSQEVVPLPQEGLKQPDNQLGNTCWTDLFHVSHAVTVHSQQLGHSAVSLVPRLYCTTHQGTAHCLTQHRRPYTSHTCLGSHSTVGRHPEAWYTHDGKGECVSFCECCMQANRRLKANAWLQGIARRYITELVGAEPFLAMHVRPQADGCWRVGG